MKDPKQLKDEIGAITSTCYAVALSRCGGYSDPKKVEEEFKKEFNYLLISRIVEYLNKATE